MILYMNGKGQEVYFSFPKFMANSEVRARLVTMHLLSHPWHGICSLLFGMPLCCCFYNTSIFRENRVMLPFLGYFSHMLLYSRTETSPSNLTFSNFLLLWKSEDNLLQVSKLQTSMTLILCTKSCVPFTVTPS